MAFPLIALLPVLGNVIDKLIPDPAAAAKMKLEMMQLEQAGMFKELEADLQEKLAQIEVNKADAISGNWWQSGWRPAVGWIGAFSLGYVAIVEPMSRFAATVWFNYTGIYPVIDTTITMQILFGILGLGAYRSFDKMKATSK